MKTTDIVDTPEGHTVLHTIGSYKFTTKGNDALYLIGFNNVININEQTISEISLLPITSTFNWQDGQELEHELEPNTAYWMCSYINSYFLFDNLSLAIDFIATIQTFKMKSLLKSH